jgi:hypothetical protein
VDLGNGLGSIDIKRKWNWPLWLGFIASWVTLTDNIAVRARPEQVLSVFNQIAPAGQ